jgi:hypothetical protein
MKTHFIKLFILSIISILMLFNSCSYEMNSKIIQINYGTSFGMCVGYCNHQVTIKADSVKWICICNACMAPGLMQKTFYAKTNSTLWDSIRTNISISSFQALPTVIGCPDCADGGAEWLELILNNGEKHKVTYEYGKEPTVIKDYVAKCKQVFNKNSCQ